MHNRHEIVGLDAGAHEVKNHGIEALPAQVLDRLQSIGGLMNGALLLLEAMCDPIPEQGVRFGDQDDTARRSLSARGVLGLIGATELAIKEVELALLVSEEIEKTF